jgi:serine/threonine protein phosphatase PrpC
VKRTFAFGAATAQGTWPVQEDGFFADPVGGVFAVADGFGGRGAGDMAAKAALLEVRGEKGEGEGKGISPGVRVQREIFFRAHRAITARNQPKGGSARGGCSLVMATAAEGAASVDITQCGACAVLLVRDGSVRPLLLPQASPREEFQPLLPDQALGLGEAAMPEARAFRGRAGDILLLLSGGVEWESESFREEALARLGARMPGGDLSSVASALVESGGLSSQGWNRTILLIELN